MAQEDMVKLPGGWFMMGSNDTSDPTESTYDPHLTEGPVHRVYVDAFQISKYEITFDQYDFFCEQTGRRKASDEGWGRGQRPVINVTWFDALSYCEWLFRKTGKPYRLPTEAEWEYACRAGAGTRYYWGTRPSGKHANGNNAYGWPDDRYEYTAPVGSFKPNAFGLYDMIGNVHEWCLDDFDKNYYKYSAKYNPIRSYPRGSLELAVALIRGGGWQHYFGAACSYRGWWWKDKPNTTVGFRIALTEKK